MSQPWLHHLSLALAAPTQVWSGSDGQIRPGGLAGAYHGDRRVLSQAVLLIDGAEATPVASYEEGGDVQVFVAVPRQLGDRGADPTVRVVRRREVEPGLVREQYVVSSTAHDEVTTTLSLLLAADLAALDEVKGGRGGHRAVPPSGVGGPMLTWTDDDTRSVLRVHHARTDAVDEANDATGVVRASWSLEIPPGGSVTRELLLTVDDLGGPVAAPSRDCRWGEVSVVSADRRLGPAVARCVDDLQLLRLVCAGSEEEFVGAGAPWFLTLFGRDSLWTARMMLPFGTSLAGSTLRELAHRQGRRVDVETAEEPGKILHEVRRAAFVIDDGESRSLPPVYYGTIDATPLWALTLTDAWAWGLPADEVEQLLPALEAALGWQVEHGDPDGDHLLEYVDRSGHGLSNQGWKDSGDALRRHDGTLASAPVALCEVQGYAYAAATRGADLLEAFGRTGTDRWRAWAERLEAVFRRHYWVEDATGPFPAIALDRDKRPVVSLTSNIGHLLGTGLLSPDEAALVAGRLAAPDMLTGFGIRTMSRDAAGYSPTGYHVGSVWPHDTAICLAGLVAERRPEAAAVAANLLAALHAFDGRPPELFAGDSRDDHATPLPYPAACRPQAWAAAAAVSLVASLAGLRPPVGGGPPTSDPITPWTSGSTVVQGVRVGEIPYDVAIDEDGRAEVTQVG